MHECQPSNSWLEIDRKVPCQPGCNKLIICKIKFLFGGIKEAAIYAANRLGITK